MAGSSAVQLAGMVLAFLVGVQLARGLGVEAYGQYGIAMAVVTLASIPGEFGLPRLVTREVAAAASRKDFPGLFGVLRWSDRLIGRVGITVALITAAAAYLLLQRSSPEVAGAILWGAALVPLVAWLKVRGGALQGLHHVVLGQVPAVVVRPALFSLLLFALFQFLPRAGAPEAMLLNLVTAAAALALTAFWLRSRLPADRPAVLREDGRRWLASGAALGVTGGVTILQSQLLVFLLALFETDAEVGLFRIALSIMTVIAAPIAVVATVVSPLLASLHSQGDLARLKRLAKASARFQSAGVLLIAAPFLLAAEPIISAVFGPEYGAAAGATRILAISQVVSAVFGVNATLLNMTGEDRKVTRAICIALVANMAAAAVLIPWLGGAGAAWSFIVGVLVLNVMAWIDARRTAGVNTFLR